MTTLLQLNYNRVWLMRHWRPFPLRGISVELHPKLNFIRKQKPEFEALRIEWFNYL